MKTFLVISLRLIAACIFFAAGAVWLSHDIRFIWSILWAAAVAVLIAAVLSRDIWGTDRKEISHE